MTATPKPAPPSAPGSDDELARLDVQVKAMRAVLVRLMQDVVVAESRLAHTESAKIVEVNERLVLTSLASQDSADTAAMALEQVQSSATLDAMTRLPNRTALSARLAQAIAGARRHGSRLALLFVDLDDFKRLNDLHGHAFGDKMLCLVANRMLATVREVDTVSRHGGDEFLVLLAELAAPRDAQAVADKLLAAIGAPATIEGHVVRVTASVGIAIYPDDGQDERSLVKRADAAMYEAKRRGPGGFAFQGTAAADVPGLPAPPGNRADSPADPERRHALLREANEKLVLAALSAHDLKAAAEQAQQRQTAFMAEVAVELRNPWAPIRIAAAMLGRPTADQALLPHVQGIIETQMAQMSRLVGKLVDGTNVNTSGLQLELGPVDMARVVDECVAAYQLPTSQRAQRLELHRPPGVLLVQGDAYRLVQVVGNLLDNASCYTQDGGQISLSVVTSGDTLTLTVSDNGIGISPQMLARVADPFVQDTLAIGINGIGLGIGLTIVHAVVRAHGGTLVAHSEGIERGSRFVVTLPLAATGTPAPAPGPKPG